MIDFPFLVRTFFSTLKAVPVSLEITVVSLLLAILPALLIAFVRIKRIPVLTQLGAVYVSLIRGTPIVLQILVLYSLLPSLIHAHLAGTGSGVDVFGLNPIVYAFAIFGLNTTATLSEVFRAALLAVDKGQYEAGISVGLSSLQVYRRIVFPQAIRAALPNICNLTIAIFKNTSLAFMMTVKDITAVAKIEASFGYNYIEAYTDIFFVYIIVCLIIQKLFKVSEERLSFKSLKGVRV